MSNKREQIKKTREDIQRIKNRINNRPTQSTERIGESIVRTRDEWVKKEDNIG